MRRKPILLAASLVLLLLGGAGLVALLVLHEPSVYHNATLPPGPQRKQRSSEFQTEFCHFLDAVNNREREWSAEFTQEQINSFFEEDFVRSGLAEKVLPEGVRGPRLTLEPDKIRLAFRYDLSAGSTVITIDLGLWLTNKQPNVVALEIQGLRAGALPITAQSLLERISECGRGHDIDVSWYRLDNGHPVALLRFQADKKNPTVQLRQLEVKQGRIVIGGRSLDAAQRALLRPLADFRALRLQ